MVVVKFSAEWCGPCKAIAPHVERLAKEHEDVVFIHVDVDNEQLANCPDGQDVRGVPTFKFFKNKKLVESFAGANASKITETIVKHK